MSLKKRSAVHRVLGQVFLDAKLLQTKLQPFLRGGLPLQPPRPADVRPDGQCPV